MLPIAVLVKISSLKTKGFQHSFGQTMIPSADGSVDIYIQKAAPAGHKSNWLHA
jgi:hypothetical protein